MNEFIIWSEFPEYNYGDEEEGEQDFDHDPYGYSVSLNGKTVAEFGDWYHDKGQAKAEGFVQGYALAMGWQEKAQKALYTLKYDERINKEL